MTKLYQILARKIDARLNCLISGNADWKDAHEYEVERLVNEHLPSGGGFDAGTKLDWGRSTSEKLVFTTAFHHMNAHGFYDGWTDHVIVVKPSLVHGFVVDVKGRNRNDIKDFAIDCFNHALSIELD
jgi:hypothetical protein